MEAVPGTTQRYRNDEKALDAYGNLSAERGENQDAERAFQQVLKLDPQDLTALVESRHTGVQSREICRQSLALLQPAFDANKDVAGLAMNLARVQCMAGDAAGARTTLESALIFAPGLQDLRHMRDQMPDCGLKSQGAAQ